MTLVNTRRLLRSCAGLSEARLSESERGAGRAAESAKVSGRGARSPPANAQAPRRRKTARRRRKSRGMCALCAWGIFSSGKGLQVDRFSLRQAVRSENWQQIKPPLQAPQAESRRLYASLSRRRGLPGKAV